MRVFDVEVRWLFTRFEKGHALMLPLISKLGWRRCLSALFLIGLSADPGNAIFVEQPKYLQVPEAANPLEGLLPKKGLEGAQGQGMLQVNSQYLKRKHNINFETRQVEVIGYVSLNSTQSQTGAQDSTPLWQSYYRELNTYSLEMNDLAFRKLWLNQFIGKEEASQANSGGLLDIVLPVNVPDWMRRIGVDKPRLRINGSYKLVIQGSRLAGNGAPGGGDNWFPNLHMDQQPAFSVKGSIGRLINIEINSEDGFGTNLKEQLKITYKGEGDELEDDIIQEIEAGNTSLALTGTALTGYTESHKGLFGLKMRMKFGDLEVTTIASQEGGTQERQTLGSQGLEQRDFVLEDRAMDLHRHFFLNLKDREEYRDPARWVGNPSSYANGARTRDGVKVYQNIEPGKSNEIKDSLTACAYDEAGRRLDAICERGRWQELNPKTDFFYNKDLRLLTVPAGHRSLSIAVRWEGDPVTRVDGLNSKNLILLHSRSLVGVPELDSLMWRNVYNIGKVSKDDKQNFRLKLVSNSDSLDRNPGDILTFIRKLGLDNPTKPDQINIDDPKIFDLDQGLMILPCIGGIDTADNRKNCLTPMKRVNSETKIYSDPVDEIQNGPTIHKFVVTGKQRKSTFDVRENSHSVSGSSCMDIERDTEKLILNRNITLTRNVDYEVLYETGQITLLSPRAKDPGADIEISYECNPPFQIQDKILLGTRLEYKLDGISEGSLLGATVLYKSQTTTAERPELGHEPFNQFLWGFNARLTGNPKWMTHAVNFLPFIQTEAPSKANFEFEVAQSRYNPNTKGGASLDDFENSENILTMPMTLYSWFKASPPEFDNSDNPNENLDYRHQGLFIWHSSMNETYSRIYGRTGNTYTDSREQTLLKLSLVPNDNLEGHSWGGVMRALSSGLFNQSKKRTLEVVVNGREGMLNVELGQISEDISIAGINNGKPDGSLQSELKIGQLTNAKDPGLDGVKDDEGENGVRWECKPTCYATPNASDDRGEDQWKEPTSGATEEDYRVNGTEGNYHASQGFGYDTEDIDRSGVLDKRNTFLRYQMPLDSACSPLYHCEILKNGWRKYQIPLYGSGIKIGAIAGESENQILSNVKIVRMWMGSLPSHVTKSEALIARVNLVGNTWEESVRNRDYEIDEERFASGDLRDSAAIRLPPSILDSNRLKVTVVNKQEEKSYFPSPNTKIERDTRTDEQIPERSLVLRYENLHPGEIVSATRLLGSDVKDLTRYSRILMEIHPDSNLVLNTAEIKRGQNKVSLGLRLGKDQGNRDSKDYYEIKIHMDTLGQINAKHVSLWEKNSFEIPVSALTSLKNDSLYQGFSGRLISAKAWHEGRKDSSLTISVIGNPSLSRVDWMRLVVYVDSNATEQQSGDIWVNDLRLEGVDASLGTSMRTSLQLDFSDFLNVSGNLTYRNGNFTTMSETKATPANSQSQVDYSSNLTVFANKFFPETWGVAIPLSLQYNGAISRPFTKPNSDLGLNGTGLTDILGDILDQRLSPQNKADSIQDEKNRYARVYQSTVFGEKFTASYKKERRSSNYLTQTFLERPDLIYSYSASERNDFFSLSESRSYSTKLMYNLSPFSPKTYKPLEKTEKWKFMPSFLSSMEVTPLPEKVNLTLGDLSYSRETRLTRPRNAEDRPPVIPANFDVALTHGFDMEWRLLSFFNFGYRLTLDRDFDNDHECFDQETFFGGDADKGCDGGFMASNILFDFDSHERNANHFGEDYLILYRERNRNQTFHADFNPSLFSWLTLGSNYNAGYQQRRADSILDKFSGRLISPEHFEANADHDIKLNASLNLPALIGPAGDGKGALGFFRKKMEDWRLRSFDGSYSVTHRYNNEEFTYADLRTRIPDPTTYYAYQLGFVYQGFFDVFSSLLNGEPNPTFMDYLTRRDPALGSSRFSHGVNRSIDGSTGLTIPMIDLSLSFNIKYSKEYTLWRDKLPSDTSVTWPDITLTGTFGDFATKIPFLRKKFRSMTSTTTFNYREEERHSLFSETEEAEKTSYRFDPLLRLAATTNTDVRTELGFKASLDQTVTYGKTRNGLLPFIWSGNKTNDSLMSYTRTPEKKAPTEEVNLGADISLSKDIETQKGIQFWRYYIKLQNNLRLKATGSVNYQLTERTLSDGPVQDRNALTLAGKPEATYNFTSNVDALFYLKYEYIKLWHTPKEETTHELAVHGEFTMRF